MCCPMPSNVVNLPQSCHNVPQPPQGCMADMPRLRLLGQGIKQQIISMVKNLTWEHISGEALKTEHISGEARISMVKTLTQEHISGEVRFYMVKHLKTEHISGEARISVVKNLTQISTHVTEMVLNGIHGVELQKEEQYSIETIDYSPIVKMNRRISLQMITPVSTQHYDIHLGK